MADLKLWSVTYTKHVTRKHKVYQDGFLELHTSSNKAKLYDDCKKLLECRILKQNDAVISGETLTFSSYLVDIGDPHGDCKPKSEKSGDRNTVAKKNTKGRTLSPSQKIIREFKKSKLQQYGTPKSSIDSTKTTTAEWEVLYTTQLTQKAKKYHDGFLRLKICGLQGRQAMLYDANKKFLDSRFLKKDEVIRSGESISFETHLVDIGDSMGKQEPLIDLHVQGSNSAQKTGIMHGQHDCPKAENSVVKEWNVLYTSQITQKTKKYHNGILKLSFSGSYHNQVSLLNEDKTILSSKHLSLSVDVGTGCTLELPKYLVEVGDPYKSTEGKPLNDTTSKKHDLKLGISHGDKNKSSMEALVTNKPLRDANQILSILQKPISCSSTAASHTQNSMIAQASSSKAPESLDSAMLDLPEENLNQKASPVDILSKNLCLGKLTTSAASDSKLVEDAEIGTSNQLHSANVETESKRFLENLAPSPGPTDDATTSSKRSLDSTKMENCPSFDLGF